MIYANSPIGKIQIPKWEEEKLINLSDEELLLKALDENKKFVISPAVYAMIEGRGLDRVLQNLINPSVGFMRAGVSYGSIVRI